MNIHLLRRRQLLWYFGLAAGTPALSIGFRKGAFQSLIGIHNTTAATIDTITPSRTGDVSGSNENRYDSIFVAAAETTQSIPQFQGISQWLNSAPLNVADLKGNVVLVQFWTFACINCQRTLPYITRWHRQYAAQGLRVVGVHTPEFPFERDVNNVKRALKQHQITYPVPLDNDYKTWEAYQNNYWPHLFLADRQGFLRYDHIGEGAYEETEQTIRKLLG